MKENNKSLKEHILVKVPKKNIFGNITGTFIIMIKKTLEIKFTHDGEEKISKRLFNIYKLPYGMESLTANRLCFINGTKINMNNTNFELCNWDEFNINEYMTRKDGSNEEINCKNMVSKISRESFIKSLEKIIISKKQISNNFIFGLYEELNLNISLKNDDNQSGGVLAASVLGAGTIIAVIVFIICVILIIMWLLNLIFKSSNKSDKKDGGGLTAKELASFYESQKYMKNNDNFKTIIKDFINEIESINESKNDEIESINESKNDEIKSIILKIFYFLELYELSKTKQKFTMNKKSIKVYRLLGFHKGSNEDSYLFGEFQYENSRKIKNNSKKKQTRKINILRLLKCSAMKDKEYFNLFQNLINKLKEEIKNNADYKKVKEEFSKTKL